MKGFEHLENALGGVFADVDAAGENFARGVEDDQLGFFGVASDDNAVGDFAEHGFVEEIVVGTVEGNAGDGFVDAKFYEFELAGMAAGGLGGEVGGVDWLDHGLGLRGMGWGACCCAQR